MIADGVADARRQRSESFDQFKALFAAIALPGADAEKLAAIGERICSDLSPLADPHHEKASEDAGQDSSGLIAEGLKVTGKISDEAAFIERLAAEVARRIPHPIPLEIDLWDAEQIAVLMKVGPRQVAERYSFQKGFPRPIVLPTGGVKQHRRWKAVEILEWLDTLQTKAGKTA